jgi:uncharacterized protein YeaO (DUF488 family)
VRNHPPINLKRVYETPSAADGLRVLVDGLWPRGLSKRAVAADLWLKEAAPSRALRSWYGHDPRRWQAFAARYRAELARRPEMLHLLEDLQRRTPLTLVFGARDTERNNAVVLRAMLDKPGGRKP